MTSPSSWTEVGGKSGIWRITGKQEVTPTYHSNTLSALGICPAQFHEDSSELRVVGSYRLVRAQMPLPPAED